MQHVECYWRTLLHEYGALLRWELERDLSLHRLSV